MKDDALDEIVVSRRMPVGCHEVYAAFADPARLALWWGPHGFTTTVQAFDLREGAKWHLVMRGPDGTEYAMEKRFLRVHGPNLVVMRHEQSGHSFDHVMECQPIPGGSLVTWRMRFDDSQQLAPIADVLRRSNEENLERLAAHLASV